MRRLLLATTAITALAIAPALVFAQVQSNGPSGAIQEQPPNKEHKAPPGKAVTPAPGPTAPGKSVQTQTPPTQQPQRMQGQAQPQPQQKEPGGQQKLQGQTQTQQGGSQHVQGQPQQPTTGAAPQRQTGTASTSSGARGQRVQVTQQQKTQIHERISRLRVERIDHPRFSVTVGTVVPRSVHIEVLPPEIVEVVPEYQGFDYVMVGDEILIIDPYSLQIVAVIPA
ncbi:MAG: DUF1236 domain-containing protein [Stellaceae bacterium]